MPTLEALFQDTLPHVRRQALRLATPVDPVWDAEDLFQEGAIGLLAALTHYDPARNVQVWTYAEFRVCGAIQEAKRARFDPVPRSVRRKARAIAQAVQALAQQLGRAPEGDEIAQALGLSQDTYEAWRLAVAGVQSRWSLDYPTGRGGMGDISLYAFLVTPTPGPAAQVERAEAQRQRAETVARVMDLLPAHEQQVIRLRYWEEQDLKTIGAQLDLSESRISQLHSAALTRLRRWLTTDDDWPRLEAQITQQQSARQQQAFARQDVLRTQGKRAYLRLWRAQQKLKRQACSLLPHGQNQEVF